MQCENEYCIYHKSGKCRLNNVTINSVGICDDCIIVSLDEDFLRVEKERQLQQLDSRWEATAK